MGAEMLSGSLIWKLKAKCTTATQENRPALDVSFQVIELSHVLIRKM